MRTGTLLRRATDEPTRSSCLDGSLPCAGAADKSNRAVFLGFLAFAGIFLFRDNHRRRFYLALILAAMPLMLVTVVISLLSPTMSFFREPGITEKFGFSLTQLAASFRYLIDFYSVLLPVAMIGAVLVIFRATRGSSVDRQLLVWLLPLANLFITPLFRAGRVELLWLVPSIACMRPWY